MEKTTTKNLEPFTKDTEISAFAKVAEQTALNLVTGVDLQPQFSSAPLGGKN